MAVLIIFHVILQTVINLQSQKIGYEMSKKWFLKQEQKTATEDAEVTCLGNCSRHKQWLMIVMIDEPKHSQKEA